MEGAVVGGRASGRPGLPSAGWRHFPPFPPPWPRAPRPVPLQVRSWARVYAGGRRPRSPGPGFGPRPPPAARPREPPGHAPWLGTALRAARALGGNGRSHHVLRC